MKMTGMIISIFQRNTNRTRNIHSGHRKYKQHDSYPQTYKYMKKKTITLYYYKWQVSKKFDSLRENFLTEPTVKKKARCLKKFSLPIMAVIDQILHKNILFQPSSRTPSNRVKLLVLQTNPFRDYLNTPVILDTL